MLADSYLTIVSPSEGIYKEKGSKFIAHVFPMNHENAFNAYLNSLKSDHPKARHFCYAYKYNLVEPTFRANDDGEPSGTAGKPIYGQIRSFDLMNVGVIVIRYFGGTKLGASGLITAYKEASIDAINNATITKIYISRKVSLVCGFEKMGHCLNVIKKMNLDILSKNFTNSVHIELSIRNSEKDKTLLSLKAKLLDISEEQVLSMKGVPFYRIEEKELLI